MIWEVVLMEECAEEGQDERQTEKIARVDFRWIHDSLHLGRARGVVWGGVRREQVA